MTDRIMIVGAGAIGGVLAGYLGAAGRSVTLFARGEPARMVAEHGIRLTTPDQRILHSRPRVVASASEAGEQDIVLFATKAFSLPAAMRSVLPVIGPKTVVVPVVNGVPWWFGTALRPIRAVDPDGSLVGAVPAERLVGATIYSPARRTDSGEWIHMVPGKLVVGPTVAGGSDTASKRVADVFEGTEYGTLVTTDIHRAVWSKLVTNGSFNPLCSLTGAQQIDVARDKTLGECALGIMREIETLARACGSGIDGVIQKYFDQAYNKGTHKPSTLQDFEAGRQVELAAFVDAPIELARQRGIAMPILALIGAAVRLKAASAGLLPDAT
ncbi:MAG: ketopantoate reductase family protein [Burkholderiales bacterium]